MISEGDDAPRFALPALADGEHRRVGLDDYLGEDVVILAFYPGDFNPACDAESDLDELDLFTMQKDVTVLGISADSLYSHAAFAAEYDLHIPLLSDTRRDVAEQYGVAFEGDLGQALVERAVFVVDHDGVVQYAWSTRELTALPHVDEIKDAIAETGGDDTAFARYRVGHAHYTEGRRAFTSAMGSFQDSEWMLSQSDFKRAQEEFEEAAEHFDSAVRFVDDPDLGEYYDHAEEKATALWQAAEWLTKSASEYSSGAGAEGQRLRDDAERPLETARDLGEPIAPDDWPPALDIEGDETSILPEDDETDTTLAVDIDAAAADAETADDDGATSADDGTATTPPDDGDIDDEDLEQLTAELAASQPDDPVGEEIEDTPTSMVDAPPDVESAADEDTGDDGEIEDEIDDTDLDQLEADLAASRSAAEEFNSETDGDPDETDVPPPGSGSLEPTGDFGGDDGDPEGDGVSSFADVGTTDENPFATEEPADGNADTDDTDESADTDALDEPDGASDEEMAAIPTEDELDDEDDTETTDDPRY